MDCNNYSYAPTMLQEDNTILSYENDDMTAYIEQQRQYNYFVFWVSAYSYDGQLEVAESYRDILTAKKLYDFIINNYTDTPPGEELQTFIDSLSA